MVSLGSEPWCGVEPRHLATFAAVAETGSFRAAAARFGYVQSAVSQQIAHLERALGAPLIERATGNRPLTLTPAGDALVRHAERIVAQVRAASADLACMTGGGALRIVVEPAAVSLVSDVVRRVSADRPGMAITVTEAASSAHPDLLTCGHADLAIGASQRSDNLHELVMRSDPWVLVAPEGFAVAAPLDSLVALRGIALIEDCSLGLPIDVAELGMPVVLRCDRAAVTVALVRAGAGCALLPALMAGEPEGCRVIGLDGLIPPRVISLVWSTLRQHPPLIEGLIAECEDPVRRMAVAA